MTSLMIADTDGHEEAVRLPVGAGAEIALEVPDKMLTGENANPKTASLTAMKFAKRGKHRNVSELFGKADGILERHRADVPDPRSQARC